MYLCRCPHCQATFQVNIPPESDYWEHAAVDEDGLTQWVCLDCHKRGLGPVDDRQQHDLRKSTARYTGRP